VSRLVDIATRLAADALEVVGAYQDARRAVRLGNTPRGSRLDRAREEGRAEERARIVKLLEDERDLIYKTGGYAYQCGWVEDREGRVARALCLAIGLVGE